jgi:hypothetical protein
MSRRHLKSRPAEIPWEHLDALHRGEPEPEVTTPAPAPANPAQVFHAEYVARCNAFRAEHGRFPTGDEHVAVKEQLRRDRPELAR